MAKIFFSFLGTSPYIACNYGIDDRWHHNVRFVQTAILHLKCSDWGSDDRVIIGCTELAREKNLPELEAELNGSGWEMVPEVVDLPDATSEEELWNIFQLLLDQIADGDELVFDITHSFRSLPMLFTVLIQYLRVVREVKVRGVYYGAFERLGIPHEVREMELSQRNAPIIELTPFLELYDWSAGIDHFLRFGSPSDLQRLVGDHIQPILKQTRGTDDNAKTLRGVVKHLADFAHFAQYVRGRELGRIAFKSQVADPLQRISAEFLPPLTPLLQRLEGAFVDWPDQDPDNALRTVKWCIDHGLVQQGVTLLQESVVDHWVRRCADLLGPPAADAEKPQEREVWQRKFISSLLNVLGQQLKEKKWKGLLADYPEVARACAARMPEKLATEYNQLTQLRNDINHGGYGQAIKYNKLRSGLKNRFSAIWKLIKADGMDHDSDVSVPHAERVYFVTRHPGARDWAAAEGIAIDEQIDHLDITKIRPGDVIIGSLPVNLAAEVCGRGGRYLHLSLELPAELRGKELTVADMRQCGARVEEFQIQRSD